MSFVEVAVALPVHGSFTYAAPPEMALQLGHVVQVPFGRQKVTGYIVGHKDQTAHTPTPHTQRPRPQPCALSTRWH